MVNKISMLQRLSQAAKPYKLSARQVQILALVSEGHKQAAIADILGITHHTVSFHLCEAYGRMKVQNGVRALVILLES